MRLLLLKTSYPLLKRLNHHPRRRIAFTKRALFGKDTHPDNEAALMHTVKLLESLGHTVEEACPEYDQERLTYAYYIVVSTGVGLGVRQMETKEAGNSNG